MKKATTKIVWAVIAISMLVPFLLTIIINAPRVLRWIASN